MTSLVDVVVVGLGPVGQLLTLLLAQSGLQVLAVDAAPGPHGRPRAAVLDDGALAVLARARVAEAVVAAGSVQRAVGFATRGGEVLEIVRLAGGRDGWPPLLGIHQPELERALLAALPAAARLRWGAPLTALAQDAGGVSATIGGEETRGRWLVGCDGARSTVRALLGIPFGGRTQPEPWLVADVRVDRPLARVPHVTFVGDPRRPAVTLPLSPGWHRWEWMLAPGEPLPDPEPLIARWTAGEHTEVVRAVPYVFHARMAARWRQGRVLLAGDAAHVMPPFAGQGLAMGLRDAAVLARLLAADDPSGYEAQRRGHVARTTRLTKLWGGLVQARRPRLVAARDGLARTAARRPELAARLRPR